MKPVGIFQNNVSKGPDIMRKRTPISPHRVPPVWSNKVKDYVSSVGSLCTICIAANWSLACEQDNFCFKLIDLLNPSHDF